MCPCCVQSMLKLNLTGESSGQISLMSVLDAVLSRVNEAQEKFKRCCVAFADLCCAQSKTESGCCETACQDENGTLVPHLEYSGGAYASIRVAAGEIDKESSQSNTKENGTDVEEEIVLEVIGMDCPDCLSKVTQAVRILSGAEVINADGVRGLVNVKYDPRKAFNCFHEQRADVVGVIDLKAIQTFTARASGFTINIIDGGNRLDKSKVLVIPFALTSMPPQSVLDKYETTVVESPSKKWTNLLGRTGSEQGAQVDIVLRLDSSEPIQPRMVLETLAIYGATLRLQSTDQNSARIHRDLRNIAFRTLASLILTIPILVLVWSHRPLASPNVSHGAQLALATLIILVAWPIYSGSFRSAYYLHRADLGVLTSFSTLTSYIFSVIAFGFQVGGRDIGEPFFETVGLLITLIFAGRTLQAGTRKFGLKAVGNLGKLQPQKARLLDQEEREIDVRSVPFSRGCNEADGQTFTLR
jgi:cation transport ATPase